MTQREELSDDKKILNWLLGLEKETLADMAHQQSKIIEKLQKDAKAQAVPEVSQSISNPMPSGYMLNTLIKYQKWRTGKDERTLDEAWLTPQSITLAIDWAIEQLDKSVAQAVPEWIPAGERLPEHEDGLWSVPVIAMSDTGDIFILSYCGGWQRTQAFIDSGSSSITDWMPLPAAPEKNK